MRTILLTSFFLVFILLGNVLPVEAKKTYSIRTNNEIQFKVINDLGHDFTYTNGTTSFTILKDGGAGLSLTDGTLLTTVNSKGKTVTFVKVSSDLNGKSIQLSTLLK